MIDFPCTKCSQCCRKVGDMLQNKDLPPIYQFLVSKFHYKPLEDGSCEKLLEDGTWSVYEDRPIICNIKLIHKFYGGDIIEYYKITAKACNMMIIDAGLDPKYLVTIDEKWEKVR